MKVIFFTNKDKDPSLTVTANAAEILRAAGSECVMYDGDDGVFNNADAAVSFGGDGTFLRCAKLAVPDGVPVIGVHLGHTGFLSRIHPDNLEALAGIDSFPVREHAMLSMRLIRNGVETDSFSAINDIVFSRGVNVQTVSLELAVDGHALGSFLGDGVIISTATGSTGYALSAGGPVADPCLNIMLVTPICAHTSHDHAFILSQSRTLTVSPSHAERRMIYLSADGTEPVHLEPGDTAVIGISEQTLKCLEPEGHSFFNNVRIHRM